MDRSRHWKLVILAAVLAFLPVPALAGEVRQQIDLIAQVGPQGAGSTAARQARDALVREGVEIIPQLLEALDTDNIVAANWYRSAFDAIVEHEVASGQPRLPRAAMQDFVRDTKRQGRARRLALSVLDRIDPEFRTKFLPTLLDDPEFRSDAVQAALDAGDRALKDGDAPRAREKFRAAFQHSRDSSQVLRAADKLQAAGEDVDIIRHMGFLTRWYLLGPFDAPGTSGFGLQFPPERQIDLTATYEGKNSAAIRWTLHETNDRLGQLNLIQAIAAVKEAVGYAYTEFESPAEQEAELRCGADDNLTVWLNGKQVFSREQWLNGTRLDRFVAGVQLERGTNRLLVKICQGPQHRNPAVPNNWSMQLRICDPTGAGAGLRELLPKTDKQESK